MDDYKIIVEQPQSTVMAHYEVEPLELTALQTEEQLEAAFIKQLGAQGYEITDINTEEGLIANLRIQLEKLNEYQLKDVDWNKLLAQITNNNLGIEDKTELIQNEGKLSITLEDGTSKTLFLIDKKNVHNNILQVMHQYTPTGGSAKNRYDVTILVNGLPMVHIELKRRGGSIREAFNQINRYASESFWADKRLFEYVQLFVISCGDQTKYYANTTRDAHAKEMQKQEKMVRSQSNSFEFTSYWADQQNQNILDLVDFTKTFFAKHTILNILTKYCVFTVDKNLMVMRPYQISATEAILRKIQWAINKHLQGTIKAGGYIWHTTGSGKTLTSFKTAQLASKMEQVDKVLFVVDRKDLDYQTMKEYDNYEKDCANSNSSSAILRKQLANDDCKIIITTIQKLSNLLKQKRDITLMSYEDRLIEEKVQEQLKKNIVMIFDECHRSQFGDMREIINKKFKKYIIFGFTGTPIFPQNLPTGVKIVNDNNEKKVRYATTAQVFGGEPDENGKPTRPLHSYNIIDAINDGNVLRFKVDYISTMKAKKNMKDEKVLNINEEEVLKDPRYISNVVHYILEHFEQKTIRKKSYDLKVLDNVTEVVEQERKHARMTDEQKRKNPIDERKRKAVVNGFNSIFAVDTTERARLFYDEFAEQQKNLPDNKKLRIATIFTYAANEEGDGDLTEMEDENPENIGRLDETGKKFMKCAIKEYNKAFGTSYDIDAEKFGLYYKDVSWRMKNREIDLLIVVGMFLTGFDAKTLNTLWVDKNLKMHGLLQAFSRTNRILNKVKQYGNIICFRDLSDAVKKCFTLFGDKDAGGLILMLPFEKYYYGYDDEKGKHQTGYKEVAEAILKDFAYETRNQIRTDKELKEFIKLFGRLLKLRNILCTFDEFDLEHGVVLDKDGEPTDEKIPILGTLLQNYSGWYQDLHEKFKATKGADATTVNDDVEFEMELVKSIQVDIAYILDLVVKYHKNNCKDKEIKAKIGSAIGGSADLRDKRELIEKFIERITAKKDDFDVVEEWDKHVEKEKAEEIEKIIQEENLKPEETYRFINDCFEMGYLQTVGVAITNILPPMPIFGKGNLRKEKKQRVIDRLKTFFNRYLNI